MNGSMERKSGNAAEESPRSLLSSKEMQDAVERMEPKWRNNSNIDRGHRISSIAGNDSFAGRMSNGIPVTFRHLDSEPYAASIRLHFRGEHVHHNNTAILLGSKAIQEGGAYRGVSREAVELFCLEHMIMLEVVPQPDGVTIDVRVATDPMDRGSQQQSSGNMTHGDLTNLEAAMQVIRVLVTELKWETESFQRAKDLLREEVREGAYSLEGQCRNEIARVMAASRRFRLPPPLTDIDAMQLSEVEAVMKRQLAPGRMEVAIAGDVDVERVKALTLTYLGTLNTSDTAIDAKDSNIEPLHSSDTDWEWPLRQSVDRVLTVNDTEPRAVGYVLGACPNKLGLLLNGSSLADNRHLDGSFSRAKQYGAMLVLQDIVSRRLFSVVREERQLTYDADFKFQFGSDSINGSYYIVSVTSLPQLLPQAVNACKAALSSICTSAGVSTESMQTAKRSVLGQLQADKQSIQFWVEQSSDALKVPTFDAALTLALALICFDIFSQQMMSEDSAGSLEEAIARLSLEVSAS